MTDSGPDGETTLHATRRTMLAATGAVTLGGLAGCTGLTDQETEAGTATETPTRTPVTSMPDGLTLWLHPGSETVVGEDGVETWRDDSGNGNDLGQSVGDYRPALVEDAVAGTAALAFDGEDDHLLREDTVGVSNGSPRTFVVVAALSDRSVRSPMLTQGVYGSNGAEVNHYGIEANTFGTSGNRFGAFLVDAAYDTERGTDTEYHVHTLRTETFPDAAAVQSSTTYYVDGSETAIQVTASGDSSGTEFAGDATALAPSPSRRRRKSCTAASPKSASTTARWPTTSAPSSNRRFSTSTISRASESIGCKVGRIAALLGSLFCKGQSSRSAQLSPRAARGSFLPARYHREPTPSHSFSRRPSLPRTSLSLPPGARCGRR